MKKFVFKISIGLFLFYIGICALVYFNQEKIIFHPTKTPKNHQYLIDEKFDEIYLETNDQVNLHSLLLQTENPKGVILYLHGNSGSLEGWKDVSKNYLDNQYDFFIYDYRGFGKSDGEIQNEQEFFDDAQLAYDYLKNSYGESNITIVGYSVGTGTAAYLASKNNPNQLILLAPYSSMQKIAKIQFPFLPNFILKYKFDTEKYILNTSCPISIFHGDKDQVIYYEDHHNLKEILKPNDRYITLIGQGHNGIEENSVYQQNLLEILK